MTGTPITKSYVRPDKTVVVTCPHCNRQKEVNVGSFKQHKFQFKIKCVCQNVFTAQVEFRQRVRKNAYLQGTYTNLTRKNISGKMTVKNLSVSGLELTTLDSMENFKIDEELKVEFNLDDDHRTEISREVVVRQVRKNSVGCEFTEHGNIALDGPLGNYLAKI